MAHNMNNDKVVTNNAIFLLLDVVDIDIFWGAYITLGFSATRKLTKNVNEKTFTKETLMKYL